MNGRRSNLLFTLVRCRHDKLAVRCENGGGGGGGGEGLPLYFVGVVKMAGPMRLVRYIVVVMYVWLQHSTGPHMYPDIEAY